ncbi:MAG: hypothetical protein ACK4RX_04790 [Chitinophagaceae bacterium]
MSNAQRRLAEKAYPFLFVLAITYMLARTWSLLMQPVLVKVLPYAFRDDDFFSFSSGHIRRGLIGEFLYLLQRNGINSIIVFTALLLLAYVIIYGKIFFRLLQTLPLTERYLLLLTPFVMNMGIDRELFILLPLVWFYYRKQTDLVFYLIIAVILFIHEIALLFYLPFIAALFLKTSPLKKIQRTLAIGSILTALIILFGIKEHITNALELNFWPTQGVTGLTQTYLYTFGGMPVSALLRNHGSILLLNIETLYALPGILLFLAYSFSCLNRKQWLPYTTLFYLGVNALFFIMTIDYGRYFYHLFFLYLFLQTSGLAEKAETTLKSIAAPMIGKWIVRLPKFAIQHYHIWILLLFINAPIGYWVRHTELSPRWWQEIEFLITQFNT